LDFQSPEITLSYSQHFLVSILNFFLEEGGRGGWHCDTAEDYTRTNTKKDCLQYEKEEDKKAENYGVQERVYIKRQGEKLECPAVRTTINIDHVKLVEGKKAARALYFNSKSLVGR
jgi:hypothetical protein